MIFQKYIVFPFTAAIILGQMTQQIVAGLKAQFVNVLHLTHGQTSAPVFFVIFIIDRKCTAGKQVENWLAKIQTQLSPKDKLVSSRNRISL